MTHSIASTDEAHVGSSGQKAMELSAGTAVDTILAAGAATTAGAAAAAVTTATVGSASATSAVTECTELASPPSNPAWVAWDAHLENPLPSTDPKQTKEMQTLRRAAMGLTSERANDFIAGCEFVSLGCFCAPSYALQLLGVKQNSYPFDWVRSSLEGIVHCLDVQFEDFLTYSTFWMQDAYTVFGGTRWGGSFWHHNLEAPVTREDMQRRVVRFYGQGEVPACKPRFFVRCVNSTRELTAAKRLLEALRSALPESRVFLLLIVDLQQSSGAMAVEGEDGLLFYRVQESQTLNATGKGSQSLLICAEGYAQAVAFAVRYWSEAAGADEVTMFPSAQRLSASCEHWDGGDPARELFNPRRFYGQQLLTAPGVSGMRGLLAKVQMQSVCIPQGTDVSQPFPIQCFGKRLLVRLPPVACGGHMLQLCCNEGVLSATVLAAVDGNTVPVGPATVEEEPK